jgi:hypothetical protein
MAATIKGRAIVWSIGGITMTAGIVTASNPNFTQSARITRGSNKTEVVDDGGTIRTQVFHGFKKTLSMSVIPADTAQSQSGARTSADAHTLVAGTTITVVDAAGTVIDASYNLISATQNRSVEGVATVDLELEQGDEGVDLTLAVA